MHRSILAPTSSWEDSLRITVLPVMGLSTRTSTCGFRSIFTEQRGRRDTGITGITGVSTSRRQLREALTDADLKSEGRVNHGVSFAESRLSRRGLDLVRRMDTPDFGVCARDRSASLRRDGDDDMCINCRWELSRIILSQRCEFEMQRQWKYHFSSSVIITDADTANF